MIETKQFKSWHRFEIAKRTGELREMEHRVDVSVKDIRVEGILDGKWVEI